MGGAEVGAWPWRQGTCSAIESKGSQNQTPNPELGRGEAYGRQGVPVGGRELHLLMATWGPASPSTSSWSSSGPVPL